jgi:hypothetical protein
VLQVVTHKIVRAGNYRVSIYEEVPLGRKDEKIPLLGALSKVLLEHCVLSRTSNSPPLVSVSAVSTLVFVVVPAMLL